MPLTRLSNKSTTIVYRKDRFKKIFLNEYELVWLIDLKSRLECQGFKSDFVNCTKTFSFWQMYKNEYKTFYDYKIVLILPLWNQLIKNIYLALENHIKRKESNR